ncbi:MAG: hypothetical protein CMJ18_24305 [Phycisphaeraceae bacterium]|nr:hypothetical protein [Phycisphaeraceae bacterium]
MVGATKAVLGLDRAAPEVAQVRRAICDECPHAIHCRAGGPCWCGRLWDGIRAHRPTCGCSIPLKVRVRHEQCPLGQW